MSVPAGKTVKLYITWEAEGDFSFLNDLMPDDLYGLSAPAWDADELFLIKHLSSLRTLSLGRSRPVRDLENLGRLFGLRERYVEDRSAIGKSGFAYLRGLTDMRMLDLNYSTVTDEDLRHLEGMMALKSLRLRGTSITDAGLRHLMKFTSLRSLTLTGTRITREGVRRIRRALPGCQIIPPLGLGAVTSTPTPQRRPIS